MTVWVPPIVQTTPELLEWSALRHSSLDVKTAGDEPQMLQKLVELMFLTLYSTPSGIGLAAPQVGVLRRVAVIDADYRRKGRAHPILLLNPSVEKVGDETITGSEACLSLPGWTAEVKRSARVRVTTLDTDMKENTFEASGHLATVIQHEVDHLDGLLYVDRLADRAKLIESEPFAVRQADKSAAKVAFAFAYSAEHE